MSKDVDSRRAAAGEDPARGDKEKEREQRLAAALRENLRKRKAQARARSAPARSPREEASSGKADN